MPRGRTLLREWNFFWRGLYGGLGCPECVQCMPKTAETAGWLHARTAMLQISWLERSMEGADAAPCFLEGLLGFQN